MRQNPIDVPENEEIADFLNEVLEAFGAELGAVLERDPHEFNRGSRELAEILGKVEMILTHQRRKFERDLSEVFCPESAIRNWGCCLDFLGEQLQEAEWVGLFNDVDAGLSRVCFEIICWSNMGYANNNNYFIGTQAQGRAQNQRTMLRVVELEES